MIPPSLAATYVLPLKSDAPAPVELAAYLRGLARSLEVVVVDGSPDPVFAENARRWGFQVVHVAPDPALRCANGKVRGVLTGVALAGHERIVIADDDVRYDDDVIRRVVALLDDHDLVRPQNYLDPLRLNALWDTGRVLLNRALRADYPGTCAVRRSLLQRTGGYDGDVLFENLELYRTVEAAGGRVAIASHLYVRRVPPSNTHFLGQRVRQAYDSLAQPLRLTGELAVLPAVAAAVMTRRWRTLIAAVAAVVGMAELGRRRLGGRRFFPAITSLFAPLWLTERAVCSWIAVWLRLRRGGVPYAGAVLGKAANSPRELRRRHAAVRRSSAGRVQAWMRRPSSFCTRAGSTVSGVPASAPVPSTPGGSRGRRVRTHPGAGSSVD